MSARERLAPEVFRLPVERIRDAYYSDTYFALTKELLEAEGRRPRVTMQVFAKRAGLLGGIDEAIAVLRALLRAAARRRRLGGRLAGAHRRTRCTRATRSSRGRR